MLVTPLGNERDQIQTLLVPTCTRMKESHVPAEAGFQKAATEGMGGFSRQAFSSKIPGSENAEHVAASWQ